MKLNKDMLFYEYFKEWVAINKEGVVRGHNEIQKMLMEF